MTIWISLRLFFNHILLSYFLCNPCVAFYIIIFTENRLRNFKKIKFLQKRHGEITNKI